MTCGRSWRSTSRRRRPAPAAKRRTTSSRKPCGGSAQLPGVEGVASGMVVPWRDEWQHSRGCQFGSEGYQPASGEENPTCMFRPVSPRFFAVLGVPIVAGRDFTDGDRPDTEAVAIVSQSVAQRLFPKGEAVNRHLWLDSPVLRSPAAPHRRRRRRRGRRERRAGADDDGVPPVAAARRRRAACSSARQQIPTRSSRP